MVQRKLDYYFSRSSRSKRSQLPSPCHLSFLDLPYRIRRRIYILAGLVRYCPINLNQESHRALNYSRLDSDFIDDASCFFEKRKSWRTNCTYYYRRACYCPPLPVSLLYISHAISKETSRILYSENSFTISRSDLLGLKPLKHLSKPALSCLRALTVHLNNCDCRSGDDVLLDAFEGRFEDTFEDAFDYLRSRQRSELLGVFCSHPLCEPYQLHDQPLRSRTRQHAAILQEWQDTISRLAIYCQPDSLHLDLVCDTKDMEAAHDVVSRLPPIQNLKACSIRLSHIPSWHHSVLAQETADHLFGHSVGQWQENKPKGYHLPQEIISCILEYSEVVAPFDLEWSPDKGLVPFDCCTKCTATLDFCACSFYHCAYSRSCTCWRLPLSIFLVSHQVYEIAKTIFYQRNRFIILAEGNPLDWEFGYRKPLPALKEFFNALPPNTTPLLRSMGLSVPNPWYAAANSELLLVEWESIIRLLISACNTPKLHLNLFLDSRRMNTYYDYDSPPLWHFGAFTSRLKMIGSLHSLFIYVGRSNYPIVAALEHDPVEYSEELEKQVLGSDYDSSAKGKWEYIPQLWRDEQRGHDPFFAPHWRET